MTALRQTSPMDIVIRPALDSELEAVGHLTAEVFIGDGHTPRGGTYEPRLRDARDRAEHAELLVAVVRLRASSRKPDQCPPAT